VWGKLMPAAASLAEGALPIGLAHHVTLRHPVPQGRIVRWADVVVDEASQAVRIRREMEAMFAGRRAAAE
jgi:predicted homoserine dehydrogenase-like protein